MPYGHSICKNFYLNSTAQILCRARTAGLAAAGVAVAAVAAVAAAAAVVAGGVAPAKTN